VGGILGGVFGALALIALIIVGYIFILPKIRQARFESKIFIKFISRFLLLSRILRADKNAGVELTMSPVINPAYSSDA
jgi:hypothetical protein